MLDLNGTDTGVNSSATFTEDGGAVNIVGTSGAGALTVTDVDDANMESATATLTNHPDGTAESLSVDTSGTSITATGYSPTTGELSLSGPASKADYEKVLRTVKYNNTSQNPTAGSGNDRTVVFVVNDGDANSANPNSTVAVIAVNDPPDAQNDAYSVNEDNTLTVPAATGVLANDSDVDSANITAVLVSGPAHAQQFALNPDGSFNYKPNDNYNGPDSFTYKASDGTDESAVATVSLTVNPVNDAPVADNGTESMDEDAAPISIDLGALVSDVETSDANLSYTIVNGPSAQQGTLTGSGSTRTFDSADNFNGTVTAIELQGHRPRRPGQLQSCQL